MIEQNDPEITKVLSAPHPLARRVVVIGSGTMGHGIALVAARAGLPVVLCDVEQGLLSAALRKIGDFLQKGVEKGKTTAAQKQEILGRLSTSLSLEEAARGADLIIEAAPEKIGLKRELFATLGRAAPEDAI